MPKDPEALAAIGESFDDLLAFMKSQAATGQKAFEKEVKAKLEKEGKKVLGYKKALKFMLLTFAQRCGIMIWDEDADEKGAGSGSSTAALATEIADDSEGAVAEAEVIDRLRLLYARRLISME